MGKYFTLIICLGITSSTYALYYYFLLKEVIPYRTLNNKEDSYMLDNNPFSVLDKYNKEELFLSEISNMLYSPPLTNKLFVYSNLYGHELIRYYDY